MGAPNSSVQPAEHSLRCPPLRAPQLLGFSDFQSSLVAALFLGGTAFGAQVDGLRQQAWLLPHAAPPEAQHSVAQPFRQVESPLLVPAASVAA